MSATPELANRYKPPTPLRLALRSLFRTHKQHVRQNYSSFRKYVLREISAVRRRKRRGRETTPLSKRVEKLMPQLVAKGEPKRWIALCRILKPEFPDYFGKTRLREVCPRNKPDEFDFNLVTRYELCFAFVALSAAPLTRPERCTAMFISGGKREPIRRERATKREKAMKLREQAKALEKEAGGLFSFL